MNQDVVYNFLRNADKKTYSSLAGVSKDFQRTAQSARPLLQLQNEGKTAFYEGYQLTAYQKEMFNHLLTHGPESVYTVIPDWENLFIITLLYTYELSKTQKVTLTSAWSEEEIVNVLNEVEDFYELYVQKIKSVITIVPGQAKEFILILSKKAQLRLHLLRDVGDYYKIHPAYIEEQVYDVWMTNNRPSYELKEQPLVVTAPLPKSELKLHTVFEVNWADANPYALYCLLARSGGGDKMLINRIHQQNVASNSYTSSSGVYFYPLKFILQLPSWLHLQDTRSGLLKDGLNYLEVILLSFRLKVLHSSPNAKISYRELDAKDKDRLREWAIEHCGSFELQESKDWGFVAKGKTEDRVWLFLNPQKDICDDAFIMTNLGRISAEQEALKKMRKTLEYTVRYPQSRDYTLAQLKTIAQDRGVNIRGMTKKADIAQAILASL